MVLVSGVFSNQGDGCIAGDEIGEISGASDFEEEGCEIIGLFVREM